MTAAHQTWIAYLFYLAPFALIALGVARRRRRTQRRNAETFEEYAAAGMTAPASLHPVIDPKLCIGCESCVHACPEYPAHTVLGLVRGKAQLVQPTDCIGHGACKTACPVGAIRLVFGTAERGIDIPTVTPTFETNVPGIYIAGELGGMGLIRNAVEQGRQAMENIAQRLDAGRKSSGVLDVVIIGAGPAGLAASLTAQSKRLEYLTLEQESVGGTVAHFPRRKLVMTRPAVLPIVGEMKFGETSKEELMEFWQHTAKTTRLRLRCGLQVTAIQRENGQFRIETTGGSHRSRAVLLALGRRGTPRKLDVPGEELPKVVYRLTDPEQYREKHVLVVGGGDSAVEAALAIAGAGGDVTLSYRSAAISRAKPKNRTALDAAAQTGAVRLLLGSEVVRVEESNVVLRFDKKEHAIRNDAVIVCAGGVLPTTFLTDIGIQVETKYGTE